MADNVAITAGSGTIVATDERTINTASVHIQRVDEQGATAIATGQSAPTTSSGSTAIASVRETRKRIVLVNHGTVDVFIGASGVTTSTGLKLAVGAALTVYTTAAVYGVTASGTGAVHYIEEYDA